MRIGVISDTHGLVRPEVFEAFRGVDHILHGGDIGGEDVLGELRAIAPVTACAFILFVFALDSMANAMLIPMYVIAMGGIGGWFVTIHNDV